ncbi:MAG: sodium:proton antiporter [Mucilaginibacter sp.]|nr:sodium:proton antiporter [Mucilaginibacter sp.]
MPTLGTLGLILIVFEGALELRYSPDKNSVIKRSFLSALITLLASSFLITGIISYLSGQDYYRCFINAIPFCVVSSAVAIPSSSNISKEKKEFIVYESSFSDILTVILFNFMINNRRIGIASFANLGIELSAILLVSVCSCLLLLYLIGRLSHHIKSFLIISLLILVYSVGQLFNLSSLVIVLALGLFLNNANQIKFPLFNKYFIYPKLTHDIRQLFLISAESAFLLRTFFFIIFGLTMDIHQLQSWSLLVSGGIILLAIYLVRLLYIKLIAKTDIMPELVLIPRGLISILLYYGLPPDLKIKGIETGLLFVVILGTSIVMSLGLFFSKTSIATDNPDVSDVL